MAFEDFGVMPLYDDLVDAAVGAADDCDYPESFGWDADFAWAQHGVSADVTEDSKSEEAAFAANGGFGGDASDGAVDTDDSSWYNSSSESAASSPFETVVVPHAVGEAHRMVPSSAASAMSSEYDLDDAEDGPVEECRHTDRTGYFYGSHVTVCRACKDFFYCVVRSRSKRPNVRRWKACLKAGMQEALVGTGGVTAPARRIRGQPGTYGLCHVNLWMRPASETAAAAAAMEAAASAAMEASAAQKRGRDGRSATGRRQRRRT